MLRVIREHPEFSEFFLKYLLNRHRRMQDDLVDQLFNSSEKRLARTLLLLAGYGEKSEKDGVVYHISQETLAEIVGTTRSRVNVFMNKFRKLGWISYNHGVHVHQPLADFVQGKATALPSMPGSGQPV
jgi:CRP-like cAMP-binding protein